MKVKDKGALWDFLKQRASQKLKEEQNLLGQLKAEINSIELNLEKMSEMKDQYMDGLNPGSQKILPANRVRLVQTFIARLDEAAQMAKEQKGRLEEQSVTIKSRVTEHRVEEQKYLSLFEKNRAALLKNENVLEQKLSDQLTQSRWFQAKEKSFQG
jgi:flagellar export protein FliJ